MIVDFSVLFDRLEEQIVLLQIMLEREAVRRQIFAILLILAVSWLAPKLLDAALKRLSEQPASETEAQGDADAERLQPDESKTSTQPESLRNRVIRWLRAIDLILFPALFLLLAQ